MNRVFEIRLIDQELIESCVSNKMEIKKGAPTGCGYSWWYFASKVKYSKGGYLEVNLIGVYNEEELKSGY